MFDFEKFSASKFYVAPPIERVVEFSPPGIDMENITKVLSLAVDAKCTEAQAFDGYAQVLGRTSFRLTYLDGQGAPKGVDYNADFSAKVEGEFSPDDSVSADIKVVESDAQAADGLKLSAVLEVAVSTVRREELNVLVGGEGCYKTDKEVYLPTYIAAKTVTVPFEDEQEVGGEISSVLGLSHNVCMTNVRTKDGEAEIGASVYATVTYLENGQIKQQNFRIAVDESFGIDGLEDGDSLLVTPQIKSSKVVLQGVTDDNIIKLEGELSFKIQAFRCSKISIVKDIVSLNNELDIEIEKADYTCFDGCGFYSESISGSAMLGDNRAAVIDIAALPYARCYTSKAYLNEDGSLSVEGIVNTDVIYTDENGYNSVRTEIPFLLTVTSDIPFSKRVAVSCCVQSISAHIRREREIELDARLAIEVRGYSELSLDYIGGVEIGVEKPRNTSAISLYIAKGGDSVLDLCKALTAMPEDIMEQNPALAFPLSEGERVVFFRSLK